MDKFYESVNEINGCIANSDTKGLLHALQSLWELRGMESADAAEMFSVCIANSLFLYHRELLNDEVLFNAWCTYNGTNGLNYMGLSMLNHTDFCLEYAKGELLNSIFLKEGEKALDMLEKLEKGFFDHSDDAPLLDINRVCEKFFTALQMRRQNTVSMKY